MIFIIISILLVAICALLFSRMRGLEEEVDHLNDVLTKALAQNGTLMVAIKEMERKVNELEQIRSDLEEQSEALKKQQKIEEAWNEGLQNILNYGLTMEVKHG